MSCRVRGGRKGVVGADFEIGLFNGRGGLRLLASVMVASGRDIFS
jgi:hypothetical protein